MDIQTLSTPWRRVASTNIAITGAAPTTLVQTRTEPAGAGVVDIAPGINAAGFPGGQGGLGPNGCMLKVYAAGLNATTFPTDTGTFVCYVWGWRFLMDTPPKVGVWDPTLLAGWTATIDGINLIGVSGGPVTNFEVFADKLVAIANLGVANVSVETVTPGTTTVGTLGPAHAMVDLKGSQKIQVVFGTASGAGVAGANALIAFI